MMLEISEACMELEGYNDWVDDSSSSTSSSPSSEDSGSEGGDDRRYSIQKAETQQALPDYPWRARSQLPAIQDAIEVDDTMASQFSWGERLFRRVQSYFSALRWPHQEVGQQVNQGAAWIELAVDFELFFQRELPYGSNPTYPEDTI